MQAKFALAHYCDSRVSRDLQGWWYLQLNPCVRSYMQSHIWNVWWVGAIYDIDLLNSWSTIVSFPSAGLEHLPAGCNWTEDSCFSDESARVHQTRPTMEHHVRNGLRSVNSNINNCMLQGNKWKEKKNMKWQRDEVKMNWAWNGVDL